MERPWLAHYPEGVPQHLEYDRVALPGFLRATAARVPGRPALTFQNLTLTWAELSEHVDRLATAMYGLGVSPGKTVAVMAPNLPQTVIAYYAALSLGARVVLTNPLYVAEEIEHQWNDAEVELAVVMDWLWVDRVRSLRERLSAKQFLVASIPEYLRFPLNLLAPLKLRWSKPPLIARFETGDGVYAFRRLLEDTSPDPPRPRVALDDVAVLQYTGGTTGPSKAAMLSHRNLSFNVQQIEPFFVGTSFGEEVVLTCLPLFHVFGMTVCMNYAVRTGARIVLIPDPRDTGAIVRAIEKHRVTLFPGVPALFNSLNHFPGIERADVRTIKACLSGSAPIPPDVLRRFEELTGAVICEGFGLTETSPVTHVTPMKGLRKIGSIGIPVPDTDARVVDVEDGVRELPRGEEGELAIRGPQVMQGYWRHPDETAHALRDGWMYTGDLAAVDEDGYFRIVGRKKDMINANGLKVYPDEVDEVLMAHEDVLESATIGVPHPTRGETVKSFVVLRPGRTLSAADVEAWARQHMAAYKIPREVEFLDELPKSNVLKVLRRELRERELAKRERSGEGAA